MSNKTRHTVLRFISAYWLVAITLLMSSQTSSAVAEPTATRKFRDFKELRTDLLNMISGATTRIWLTSNFLSDGEIVSALYIAQYRKLDVQVLLGKAKAKKYMSRLRFLKSQSIPVSLMSKNFPQYGDSALLVDEKLLSIDGELNFMARNRPFRITYGNSSRSRSFMTAFANSAKLKIPGKVQPTRLSKRSKRQQNRFRSSRVSKTNRQKRNESARSAKRLDDTNNTYYYRGSSPKRPNKVSIRLPKKTRWQLKLEKRFDREENQRRKNSSDPERESESENQSN